MKAKNYLLRLFTFIGVICVCLSSCSTDTESDGENGFNTESNKKIEGSKWVLRNWDYSVGDDYVDTHYEDITVYFHSLTNGIILYSSKDSYSDVGTFKDKVVAHFKYYTRGNEVELDYITDNILSIHSFNFANGMLQFHDSQLSRDEMTLSDYQWVKTLCGSTGECMWYSDLKDKLWIDGDGKMADYSSYSATPWGKANHLPNKVIINEGVTSIGNNAFAILNITDIELPEESLTRIGDGALKGSLIKNVYLGDNITYIGKEAFSGCKYLKQFLSIPKRIEIIGDYAFYGCDLHMMHMDFGPELKSIGNFAFEGADVRSLNFSEGVETIGDGAFLGEFCEGSGELILPNSLQSIGATAFQGSFKKIVIGAGLKKLGANAFITGNSGEIYVNLANPPMAESNIIVGGTIWTPFESGWTLYVPKGRKTAYSKATPWNKFKSIIEDASLAGEGTEDSDAEDSDNTEYSDKSQDEADAKDSRRGYVADGFSGGTGTSSNPYTISSAAELRYFSDAVRTGNTFKNKYVKLVADITINRNVLNRNGELNGDGSNFEPWIPIGRYDPSYFFCGTFDGNGHTISGLYCNRPKGENVGFFGKLYGSVKNLTIKDSYFNGKSCVGGITGNTRPNYIGPTIPTSLKEYYQGSKEISITSCTNEATIAGGISMGGIVGISNDAKTRVTILKCLNKGNIVGGKEVGGIIGKCSTGTTIISCCNSGNLFGTGNAGGILANGTFSSVYNCLNKGDVITDGTSAGGISGVMGKGTSYKIQNCVNISTNIKASKNIGAIIGYNNGITVSYNYHLFQSGLATVGGTYKGTNSKNSSKTESELKSTDVLKQLNSRAQSSWGQWKTGSDGFPVLEWM